MELAQHILDRFWTHVFAMGGLMIAMILLLQWFQRRYPVFRTLHGWWNFVFAALPVVLVAVAREAIDVYFGQPLIKVPFDWFSWLLGPFLVIYGLYRAIPGLYEWWLQIKGVYHA